MHCSIPGQLTIYIHIPADPVHCYKRLFFVLYIHSENALKQFPCPQLSFNIFRRQVRWINLLLLPSLPGGTILVVSFHVHASRYCEKAQPAAWCPSFLRCMRWRACDVGSLYHIIGGTCDSSVLCSVVWEFMV